MPSKVQEDEHYPEKIDAVVGTSSDSPPPSSVVRLNVGYRDKDPAGSHTIGRRPAVEVQRRPMVVDQIRNDGDGWVGPGAEGRGEFGTYRQKQQG